MYYLHKEIKLEKIKSNDKRLTYLKTWSITCLILDLLTFVTFNSIEMVFTNDTLMLMCYMSKVNFL
jgi:hypothetical protein